MALLFPPGYSVDDLNNDPVSAGYLYVYENNTTTKANIFSDPDLSVALDNPIELDSGGVIPTNVYTANGRYTIRMEFSDNAEVRTRDDYFGWSELSRLDFTTLDLLKAETLSDGDRAYVSGIGYYRFDSSSTATAVGYLVVEPDSGSGRLILDSSGPYTVWHYGAVGDGTTNDTSALQAAFTAGVGRLVDGKNYLTDGLSVASAMTISGDATLTSATTSGAQEMLDVQADNVKLSGFTIDLGNTTDTYIAGRRGVHAHGTTSDRISGLEIDQVTVKNCGEAGIYLRLVDQVTIRKPNISRCGQYGIALWSSNNTRVYEPYLDDIFPGNGGVSPYLNAYGVTFSNFSGEAVCEDFGVYNGFAQNIPSWEGFDTHYGKRGEFVNCSTKNCNTGVVIQSTDSGAGTPSEDVKVLGGHHEGYGVGYSAKAQTWNTGGAVVANMGNSSTNGRGLIIDSVTANNMGDGGGSGAAAIKIEACDDWALSGCILHDSVGYGVLTNGSCVNGVVDSVSLDGIIEASNGNKRGFVFSADSAAMMDDCIMSNLAAGSIPVSIPEPSSSNLGLTLGANNRVVGGELFISSIFQNLRPGSSFLGAAREAISFNGTAGVAITSRYGYLSADTPVVRNGAGDYTLTFKNTYVLNPRVTVTGFSPMIEIEALTTTSVQIITRNLAGTATDDAGLNISVFGA